MGTFRDLPEGEAVNIGTWIQVFGPTTCSKHKDLLISAMAFDPKGYSKGLVSHYDAQRYGGIVWIVPHFRPYFDRWGGHLIDIPGLGFDKELPTTNHHRLGDVGSGHPCGETYSTSHTLSVPTWTRILIVRYRDAH